MNDHRVTRGPQPGGLGATPPPWSDEPPSTPRDPGPASQPGGRSPHGRGGCRPRRCGGGSRGPHSRAQAPSAGPAATSWPSRKAARFRRWLRIPTGARATTPASPRERAHPQASTRISRSLRWRRPWQAWRPGPPHATPRWERRAGLRAAPRAPRRARGTERSPCSDLPSAAGRAACSRMGWGRRSRAITRRRGTRNAGARRPERPWWRTGDRRALSDDSVSSANGPRRSIGPMGPPGQPRPCWARGGEARTPRGVPTRPASWGAPQGEPLKGCRLSAIDHSAATLRHLLPGSRTRAGRSSGHALAAVGAGSGATGRRPPRPDLRRASGRSGVAAGASRGRPRHPTRPRVRSKWREERGSSLRAAPALLTPMAEGPDAARQLNVDPPFPASLRWR